MIKFVNFVKFENATLYYSQVCGHKCEDIWTDSHVLRDSFFKKKKKSLIEFFFL